MKFFYLITLMIKIVLPYLIVMSLIQAVCSRRGFLSVKYTFQNREVNFKVPSNKRFPIYSKMIDELASDLDSKIDQNFIKNLSKTALSNIFKNAAKEFDEIYLRHFHSVQNLFLQRKIECDFKEIIKFIAFSITTEFDEIKIDEYLRDVSTKLYMSTGSKKYVSTMIRKLDQNEVILNYEDNINVILKYLYKEYRSKLDNHLYFYISLFSKLNEDFPLLTKAFGLTNPKIKKIKLMDSDIHKIGGGVALITFLDDRSIIFKGSSVLIDSLITGKLDILEQIGFEYNEKSSLLDHFSEFYNLKNHFETYLIIPMKENIGDNIKSRLSSPYGYIEYIKNDLDCKISSSSVLKISHKNLDFKALLTNTSNNLTTLFKKTGKIKYKIPLSKSLNDFEKIITPLAEDYPKLKNQQIFEKNRDGYSVTLNMAIDKEIKKETDSILEMLNAIFTEKNKNFKFDEAFSLNLGIMAGILETISSTDVHHDNVIFRNGKINLIDLENSFVLPNTELHAIANLLHRDFGAFNFNRFCSNNRPVFLELPSGYIFKIEPLKIFSDLNADIYQKQFIEGIKIYSNIIKIKEFTTWFDQPILKHLIPREIPISTGYFTAIIEKVKTLEEVEEDYKKEYLEEKNEIGKPKFIIFNDDLKNKLDRFIIPSFYVTMDRIFLYNSEGEVVQKKDEGGQSENFMTLIPQKTINYLNMTPYEYLFKHLKELEDEKTFEKIISFLDEFWIN